MFWIVLSILLLVLKFSLIPTMPGWAILAPLIIPLVLLCIITLLATIDAVLDAVSDR